MSNVTAFMIPMANFHLFVADHGNKDRLQLLMENWNWDFFADFQNRKNKRALTYPVWENSCHVEIQRVYEAGTGYRFQYIIHETLPGRVHTWLAKDLAPEFVDETIQELTQAGMAYQLRSHEITADMRRYACLLMEGDCDPTLHDHFHSREERDKFMQNYRRSNGDEDGLYFVTYTGHLEISAPAYSFFKENR